LARRIAPHASIDDLGRVRIEIGGRRIEGADVRRKVLALLCFLLTKPRFASTREDVVEALWPDQDPASALNSLNQAVYFLRRVFEPDYRDETSPVYVGQDGETIWLDPELVESRSRRCGDLIRAMPGEPNPEQAVELARQYRGRFALDFEYEEWASGFRDGLHASYLRVVEQAIQFDLDTGHFTRGTFLAERAAEVDPEADDIQAALVRLYRLTGAYSAAAEQYGRYVHTMRELGVEPRPLAEV
jgi:DNA-binding SARP family transcriptional activator